MKSTNTIGNAEKLKDDEYLIKLLNGSDNTQLRMVLRKAMIGEKAFFIIDCDEETMDKLELIIDQFRKKNG